VAVSTTSSIEPDLHAHRLDLGFLVESVDHDGFTLVPLGAQETAWIAASSWDPPAVVTPHDIVGHPIISNPVGSIDYRQVVGWFGSAGLAPARVDICNSVAMLAHPVTNGVAIGVYPNKMADNDVLQARCAFPLPRRHLSQKSAQVDNLWVAATSCPSLTGR
jgi:DNA-binding transcriptional LysR family regulator